MAACPGEQLDRDPESGSLFFIVSAVSMLWFGRRLLQLLGAAPLRWTMFSSECWVFCSDGDGLWLKDQRYIFSMGCFVDVILFIFCCGEARCPTYQTPSPQRLVLGLRWMFWGGRSESSFPILHMCTRNRPACWHSRFIYTYVCIYHIIYNIIWYNFIWGSLGNSRHPGPRRVWREGPTVRPWHQKR